MKDHIDGSPGARGYGGGGGGGGGGRGNEEYMTKAFRESIRSVRW